MPNVSNSFDCVSFRQCPHVPTVSSGPHRTWPPLELRMLHWLQSLSSSNMPSLLVQTRTDVAPVAVWIRHYKLQIFFGNATVLVQPHRTLPPLELRMLQFFFGNATVLVQPHQTLPPVSFGCFIGFRVYVSVDLWSLSSSKMPRLLTALPSQCCPTFFLPCSADLGGIEPPPSPNCLVVHAAEKTSNMTP